MEDRRRAERAAMALELAEPAGDLNDDPEYVEVAPEKPPPLPAPEPPLELGVRAGHVAEASCRARPQRCQARPSPLTAANARADPEAARGDPPDGTVILNRDDAPRPNPS